MVQLPLRRLQRVSICWGGVLPGLNEASTSPGGVSSKVGGPGGAAGISCRMVHNPADWHATRRPASHYDVLKVSPNATQDEIKKAYYKMSLENHPDLHGGSAEASEKFRNISEAYEVLGDPFKRSDYDAIYGVYGGATADHDVSQPESIFRRKRRWSSETRYNVRAWEQAHYGTEQQQQQQPPHDWRQMHNPHSWWRAHGPRASPYDAARYWDERMARSRGESEEARQQRKVMEERMRDLRNMHRSVMLLFVSFFFFATCLNAVLDNPRDKFVPGSYHPVDKK